QSALQPRCRYRRSGGVFRLAGGGRLDPDDTGPRCGEHDLRGGCRPDPQSAQANRAEGDRTAGAANCARYRVDRLDQVLARVMTTVGPLVALSAAVLSGGCGVVA